MKDNALLVTLYLSSPYDLFPIIGFIGLVFISTTGAKFMCIPILFECWPILFPIFSMYLLFFNAPKLMFQGNLGVESIRMFIPHSPSIPINKGTSLNDCILFVTSAVFFGVPLDNIIPPILYSEICLYI